MANTFILSIVAPDKSLLEEPVQSAVLPGQEGYFGILRGHLPMAAALKPGLLEYRDESSQQHFLAISGGFAEVAPDRVTVLADAAERASEIDIARAERALEEARRALKGDTDSTMTSEEATAELERAMNRIRAAKN